MLLDVIGGNREMWMKVSFLTYFFCVCAKNLCVDFCLDVSFVLLGVCKNISV